MPGVSDAYGRWTVLSEADRQPHLPRMRRVRCRCTCGVERVLYLASLTRGLSTSCGCWARERAITHGRSTDAEYRIWQAMIQRCHNPKHSDFRNYGGRGIAVCTQWRSSFVDFVTHVGTRPTPAHTLDRIENDGPYEPGNVRWATRHEQMANTRLTHEERERRGRINAMKRWHPELVPH